MATVEQSPSQQRIPPSRSARLADQAATAALYVTHPERSISLRQPAAEYDPATLKAAGSTRGLSNASAAAALIAHARKQEHEARRTESVSEAADQQRAASLIHEGYPYQAAMYAIKEQKAPTAYGTRKRAESAPSMAARASASARASAVAEAEADPFADMDKYMKASRIQNAHLNPKLFTATPPVDLEGEDIRRRSILEAASMSMAKDMQATKEAQHAGAAGAQRLPTGARPRRSVTVSKTESAAMQQASTMVLSQALNLHDIAQKRAAEKLAGLEDETAAYRDYYGVEPQATRSSLTVRKRRGSNETEQFDAERSKEIRTQMSTLRSKLDAVDERREKDRASLLELARKNVDATIQDMDKRLYTEAGQSVAMQRYLDEKAAERAEKGIKDIDAQYLEGNKVYLGGSKYVEMGDMEDLARSRLQPTFDEIDDIAQTQRARDVEARLDAEQRQRLAELEREREADIRAEEERHQELLKQDQKSKEEKVWPWKRKSRQLTRAESGTDKTTTEQPTEHEATGAAAAPAPIPSEAAQPQTEEAESISRRESKLKNWFNRIGRRSSAPPPKEADETPAEQTTSEPHAQATSAVTGTGDAESAEEFEDAETGREETTEGAASQTSESEDDHELTAEPPAGASHAPKGNSRSAPLRSNPIMAQDITAKDVKRPAEIGSSGEANKLDGMTPSEYFTTEQTSKEVVEQSESAKQRQESEGSIHELPTPSNEREAAREIAAVHSLPTPPPIGESPGRRRASQSTSARGSRFSEDL
ncbi:hypothetical protein BJX76DRAFT_101265 [Aspergillus varians]